jgi:hypothetical protein
MMPGRPGMALVLISTVIPAAARERTLQEQATKIHLGSKVMVQMKSFPNTVVGCLVGVTDTNFTVELANSFLQKGRASCKGSRRSLLFQDVSSIRRIREMPKAVEAVATIPVMLICGIEWIFNKNACDEL